MGDVVQFPKANQDFSPPQNLEDVAERIGDYKHIHAQECTQILTEIIFHQLDLMGFTNLDITNLTTQKNEALIFEAIRSYMLLNYNIDHPFQKLSNKIFRATDNNEGICLDEGMNIVFRAKNAKEEKIKSEV